MFALNVSCPVCKAVFKNTDAIYSTSCGHIFHFMCMNECRKISTSCPVCREYNPTSHVLFLNFENGSEYETVVKDLKAKLEDSSDIIKRIQDELEKKEKKIDDIKRLYNVSEQWRAELQDKIQTLTQQNQQQNANNSQETTIKLEEIQMLKAHIEALENNAVVENGNQKYIQLVAENSKMKKNLTESETLRIILNQKIEMQEQKLKHITLELQKQFDANFEKENKQLLPQKNYALPLQTNKTRNRGRSQRNKENRKFEDSEKILFEQLSKADKTTKKMASNCSLNHSKERKPFTLTQPDDCKIIIVNFPKENLVYPLKDTVILLALKMNIILADEDILKAEIFYPKNRPISTKTCIKVEFKTIERKTQFLTFKNRLQFSPTAKSIVIKEYIEEHIYRVFMYANRKLRGNGYEHIFCNNNKVIAKKKNTDDTEIVIINEAHVDSLLRSQTSASVNVTNSDSEDIFSQFLI